MKIPFENYVQSPIGLVPKANGDTRLIFHLSYDFKSGNNSVNSYTDQKYCKVKYNDLHQAARSCLLLLKLCGTGQTTDTIWFGKSDLKSAFRILGLSPKVFLASGYAGHKPLHWRKLVFRGQMFTVRTFNQLHPIPKVFKCSGSHFQVSHQTKDSGQISVLGTQ